MPLDPGRAAETREWLAKASLDLRAAELDLTADPPLTTDTAFHCQQLAEKSLKAFLTWHDRPFRKTHDLVEVGQLCVAIDATLEAVVRRGAALTEYAWKFRYPGESDAPGLIEVEEALVVARELHAAILDRLPEDVRVQGPPRS